MPKFYVTGKIASLDIGAEIDSENQFMAAIEFRERYDKLLEFGLHKIQVIEVEEVVDNGHSISNL